MKLIVSTKQVADFFGVTPRSLQRWAAHGCPKVGYGRWDLKQVFVWWQDNIERGDDSSLAEVKRRYWQSKAAIEQIKAKQIRGTLITKSKMINDMAEMARALINALTIYEDRLPPQLEGKTKIEMREIIHEENKILRKNLSASGEKQARGSS